MHWLNISQMLKCNVLLLISTIFSVYIFSIAICSHHLISVSSAKSEKFFSNHVGLCSLLIHRGSAIAKIVGSNTAKYATFEDTVNMWVFEEMVNGRKLTEIINTEHENVKYLPGHKLPPNVVWHTCVLLLEGPIQKIHIS